MDDSGKETVDRRTALARLGGLGGLALAGCTAPTAPGTATPTGERRDVTLPARPNVVVVFADDLGWYDVGFQGSRYYETPNLDALAADGLTFRAGYANAPNCAPSRACLLTGQYTPRHGVYTVGYPDKVAPADRKLDPPPNNRELPTRHATVAEVLSRAGYDTGFVGKYHVGEAGTATGPRARGFDRNVAGGIYGFPPKGYYPPYGLPNLADRGDEYLPDRLADHAVRFLRDHADGADPFFLLLSTYVVHTPLEAPEANVAPYRNKPCWRGQCNPVYGGMVSALDRVVGRVRTALESLGVAGETLIVFASDNGGVGDYDEVGIRGNWSQLTSQGPLRGGKGTLYEGGIRVPTVVTWPGELPAGRVNTPVAATDLLPTLAELAGAEEAIPDDHAVDGESLVPLLERGEPPDREALFWHFPAYLPADVDGAYRTTPGSVVRAGRWKLHHYYGAGPTELYDLRTDRGETTNLADERPDVADRLRDRLDAWRRAIGARKPTRR